KHPAYPTAMWNLEPDRKGLVPVAAGRGGPFNMSWEIHGVGPIKLIVSVSHAHDLTSLAPSSIIIIVYLANLLASTSTRRDGSSSWVSADLSQPGNGRRSTLATSG